MTERSHPGAAKQRPSGDGAPPASGPSPEDLETLAAFIDQRLADDERQAFMRRLDEDQALYEVFVDTVRCREEAAAGGPAEVVTHPASRRAWLWPAAAAAVVAAGLTAALLLLPSGGAPAPYGEALVADGRLEPILGADWYEHGWRTMRGITAAPGGDNAFRLGVRAVDLEVALRSDRRRDAERLTHRIEALLAPIELSDLLAADYRRLREELASEPAASSRALLRRASEAEERMARHLGLADAFELGRWAEAGRLAASSGNTRLLASQRYRRGLRRLEAGGWTPEVEGHLATLATLLAAPRSELDLAAIDRTLTALIEES